VEHRLVGRHKSPCSGLGGGTTVDAIEVRVPGGAHGWAELFSDD